jgi:hypothetical protein
LSLKAKHYIRYADDFVFLHHDKDHLTHLRHGVDGFLGEELKSLVPWASQAREYLLLEIAF